MAADKETREVEIILKAQDANASIKEMAAGVALMNNQLAKMSQDDPRREQLKKDFQDLKSRVKEARDEVNGLTSSEEKLRLETEKLVQETENLNQHTKQALIDGQKQNASFHQMKEAAGLLEKELHKLSTDDPGRKKLIDDYQALQARLAGVSAEMKTVVKTEAQLREEQEKLRQEEERFNQQQVQVILNGQKLNSSFKEMKDSAAILEKQLHEMSSDDPGRKKMLSDYQALQGKIAGVTTEMKGATEGTSFLKQGFATAFGVIVGDGISGILSKIVGVGEAIFETTAKFQTYESVMTNALGDKSKAQQAMKDIQQMAAKTPFSVDELTGSFIKFVNRGLNPSMAEMTKLADLAASQGKSFDQLTEAVLDAGGGEFERLKEFGIKASKSGDQVALSFKGITQSVKNTPDAINAAIMAFGGMKGVAGSTAAISATLAGQLSNLGDSSDQLKIKIGEGLKPVFTLILTLFGSFISWIGRFVDEAKPLVSVFGEIGSELKNLYSEIGETLESLGLFSSKTDTVKIAVEVLKVALTVLIMPLRMMVQVSRYLVENFIEWYNKSELLRGTLGGLGAVIVSLFTTIKNDALKILGGVGDIIVGIFTLDKDKIVAGFKSAFNATADAALAGGSRAADAFKKGFDANKNSKIVRKVSVETNETSTEGQQTGTDLKSDASGADAAAEKKAKAAEKKAKADRDRADREHLADLKRMTKDVGHELELRNAIMDGIDRTGMSDAEKLREQERQKIFDSADKDIRKLTGQETDYTEQVAAIVAERDQRLRTLAEKHAQEAIDQQIANSNAEAQEMQAQADVKLAQGIFNQQQYEDAVFGIKQAAMQRELDLIKQRDGAESAAWKKLNAEKIKSTSDQIGKEKKQKEDLAGFEKKMQAAGASLLHEGLQLVEDNLNKKTVAYQLFKAARKTAELAELGINLAAELSANAKAAAENPLNGVTAGAAGATQLAITDGLSIVRAVAAGIKIAGFAKGGATGGDGTRVPSGPAGVWDMLTMATGLRVGSNGQLSDENGLEVAGIVHKNEYVIPEWMRADPQVVQVEHWLEQRRVRGYYQGGDTGGDAASRLASAAPVAGATDQRLVQVLESLDHRLQQVEQWPTSLDVVLDVLGLDRDLEKLKKVKSRSEIRPK